MTKLIYITHPEVIINPQLPIINWQLSNQGKRSLERLLKLDLLQDIKVIYSSGETKAREVAEATSGMLSIKYATNSQLNELDRSSTKLLPLKEYMKAVKFTYENPDESYKGWETLESSFKRNTAIMDKIMKKNKGKTVLVIGHGSAGTLIKCFIKGVKPSFNEDPQQTGCYFVADWEQKKIITDWTQY